MIETVVNRLYQFSFLKQGEFIDVLTATIYTGEQEVPVIKDAYIRFDKQIEAMGPMSANWL